MVPMDVKEIYDLMKKTPTEADKKLIKKALDFATEAHKTQKRFSGESYIVHPFEVAKILADMRTDPETIAAGLLHDTYEDGHVSLEDVEKNFGKDIAFMVDGVTKLGKLRYQGLERHVESLRKLFIAMAKDIRVILIRLADRLHNVRTLEHVRPDKQKRIALETLEIYAPLANRLGVWKIKGLLEDAAFPYAYPEDYKKVTALRKTKGKETIKKLEKVYRSLSKEAANQGMTNIQIDYRIKYLYSLYLKLKLKDMDIDKIYDISALRVIVPTIGDCYKVLGMVHSLWTPVPDRLKDYIATPKPNGYQSIHTAIFTGDGNVAEIQIRTEEMHREAQYGVTSHILYDEHGKARSKLKSDKKTSWIRELLDWHKKIDSHEEFLDSLKTDLFQDRIFVFTPKGDVIELPKGASPIDFAYAIHTDIGDHASGAMINGKFSSLDTPLKNNDLVLIEVKKNSKPSNKWLGFTKTTFARKQIKNFLAEGKKIKN